MKISAMLILALLLFGCGGNNSNNNPQSDPPDYSNLKSQPLQAVSLKPASEEELESVLKNGIRLRNNRIPEITLEALNDAAPQPDASAPADAFSTTNVHVSGVDESDFVKYDGKHLYVSSQPHYTWGINNPQSSIRIMATDATNASASEVASIDVSSENWGATSELFLVQDSEAQTTGLATLRSSWSFSAWVEPAMDAAMSIMPAASRDWIQVNLFDVTTPASPSQAWSIDIEGYLQGSRKIGNYLYLVTSHYPRLYDLSNAINETSVAWENERRINAAPLQDLLPKVRINGGEETPLISASDCLVPVNRDSTTADLTLVTLVAIDLDNQEITSRKCLNTPVSGLYASTESLYLGSSNWDHFWGGTDFTVIHKFTLNNGDINYRATGEVEGNLGWNDPAFRMDEHNGYLRVVSSTSNDKGQPEHRLTVLADDAASDTMQLIATLPNESHPDAIGKPGEQIYGVRFAEDRAFLVTFMQTDPLYVLDLADPAAPHIAGELEIPGFSNYLHPIGRDYLLGVGMNADPEGRTQGVKTSLFDIRDITNPVEINSITIGEAGSWSDAVYDLRSLSFLQTETDSLRFTLPISVADRNRTWNHNGLYMFNVENLGGNLASLSEAGHIETASSLDEDSRNLGLTRGILHNDTVFCVYNSEVWAAFWQNPGDATGPY